MRNKFTFFALSSITLIFILSIQFVFSDIVEPNTDNPKDDEDLANIEKLFTDMGLANKTQLTKSELRLFVTKLLTRGQENLSKVEADFYNKITDKIVKNAKDVIDTKDLANILSPDNLNAILAEVGSELEVEKTNLGMNESDNNDNTKNTDKDLDNLAKSVNEMENDLNKTPYEKSTNQTESTDSDDIGKENQEIDKLIEDAEKEEKEHNEVKVDL